MRVERWLRQVTDNWQRIRWGVKTSGASVSLGRGAGCWHRKLGRSSGESDRVTSKRLGLSNNFTTTPHQLHANCTCAIGAARSAKRGELTKQWEAVSRLPHWMKHEAGDGFRERAEVGGGVGRVGVQQNLLLKRHSSVGRLKNRQAGGGKKTQS